MPSLLRTLAFGALGALALAPAPAQAYPLNPWGAATPTRFVALTPYLYVYDLGSSYYPYLYASYGIVDGLDVIGGVGAYLELGDGGGAGLSSVELMPRWFFSDQMGVALHLTGGGGALKVAPEFHGIFGSSDAFMLTLNAGFGTFVGEGGFSLGGPYALIAPEYALSDRLSVFCEVNPSLSMAEGVDGMNTSWALTLVPGVGLTLDEEGSHTMAVGVQAGLVEGAGFGAESLSLGLWYSTGFGGE